MARFHHLPDPPIAGPLHTGSEFVTLAELFQGLKPKLPLLISPVKKPSRVESRAIHKKGAQGALL